MAIAEKLVHLFGNDTDSVPYLQGNGPAGDLVGWEVVAEDSPGLFTLVEASDVDAWCGAQGRDVPPAEVLADRRRDLGLPPNG